MQTQQGSGTGSVQAAEIARFGALAQRWWEPSGPMRPLHLMNPVRTGWILAQLRRRSGSAQGVRVLDVGCGAGLLSEALAKAGCEVLGLDASDAAIAAARSHAGGQNLPLRYRQGAPEDLAGTRFPVITALEIIEHVPDPAAFVMTLAGLLEPGGLLFLSTLNRTARAFLAAKLGAEYVLRMLPVGTHDWQRFITPVELGHHCRAAGLAVVDVTGLAFSPLTGGFRLSRDTGVNYMLLAQAG